MRISNRMNNMSIFSYAKHHRFIVSVTGLIVIIIAVLAGRAATSKPAAEQKTGATKVTLVNASSFREGNLAVSANGTVEAHSQADLKSQVSSPVSVIDVSIGETVYPSDIILELSNADIRASLAQAEATLATAEGQQYTGAVSLQSAKQSAIDKINDAYIKTYDVINSEIDPILYNNDGNGGRLQSIIIDSRLNNDITMIDIDLKGRFYDWKKSIDGLSASSSVDSIRSAISYSTKTLQSANQLLSDMSKAMNDASLYATPTFAAQLSGWKMTVSGALSTISGSSQTLTAADTVLAGASASQTTTAVSGVQAAQAGVNNLQAQLAKTVIRSPINGKIAALPLHEGELASPGALLATVVGDTNDILVKAFVSGDDLSRLRVGQTALVQGSIKGSVSNISPSVDPTTKKAEVDIDIAGVSNALVIGDNVTASIAVASSSRSSAYILPIQDVKIIPGAAYVYTVDKDSKIERNPVTLGPIQGDFIEITSGMDDSMNIVTPVYELDLGQTVSPQ